MSAPALWTATNGRKRAIVERLTEMRERSLALVEALSDEDLAKIHDVAVGPVNWDLGHSAAFEESWLIHGLDGSAGWQKHYDPTYDADKAPRPRREKLGLPDRAKLLETMAASRKLVLDGLEKLDLDADNPHTRDGFLHELVIQHEAQHSTSPRSRIARSSTARKSAWRCTS